MLHKIALASYALTSIGISTMLFKNGVVDGEHVFALAFSGIIAALAVVAH